MKFKVALLFLVLCTAPAAASIRVAIVGASGAEKANQVIALATPMLGDDKDIDLVDRQSVDAVLREQKLSLSGLVDSQQAIRVGQLARADVFAVVEGGGDKEQTLGIVVFDAGNGLRLANALVGAEPPKAAEAIVSAIRTAMTKRRGLEKGTQVVGFLPVRNADLPLDRDSSCEAVRILLERQLTASPNIAVLERSRLEHVDKERQLPTSQPPQKLFPSALLVQLEIGRGPKNRGLKGTAVLATVAGQNVGRVEATSAEDSPADLADSLQAHLLDTLHAQGPDRVLNRGEESKRFAEDAQVLLNNGRFALGVTAAEAACALYAGDQHRLLLSTALWERAMELLTPDKMNMVEIQTGGFDPMTVTPEVLDRSLAMAQRALDLQQESLKLVLAAPHVGQYYLDFTGGELRITFPEVFCARLNVITNIPQSLNDRIADLRAAAMGYILDYFDGWGAHVLTTYVDLINYNAEVLYGLTDLERIAPSYAKFAAAREHLIHQWRVSFDKVWPHAADIWMQGGLRQSEVMTQLLDVQLLETARWKDFDMAGAQKGLASVAEELNHSDSPVMHIYGTVAAALADPQTTAGTLEARDKTIQSLFRQVEPALNKPVHAARRGRTGAYIAAVDGLHLLPSGADPIAPFVDLLAMAIRRKEVIPYAAMKLVLEDMPSLTDVTQARAWMDALQKMSDLAQTDAAKVLDGNADGVRQAIAGAIYDLRKQYPELGEEKKSHPWSDAQLIADVRGLPGVDRFESCPQISDKFVYAVASGNDAAGKFFLQAVEIPRDGGAVHLLGKVAADPLPAPGENGVYPTDGFPYHLIQSSALDEHNFYVCVRDQGVVAFPRDGSAPKRIDQTAGLPSNWAQFVVSAGGQLYISCSDKGGAYLVRRNKADSMQVRVSSMRKESKSPLDNTPGLRIEFVANDAPRDRLLLGVGQYANGGGDWGRGGLWELSTKNGRMKRLLTEAAGIGFGHFRGIDGDYMYAANTLWVVQYDLKQDHGRYLSFKPGTIDDTYIRDFRMDKDTKKGSVWAEPDTEEPGARRVIDNWLWIGEPFSRISADGKSVESLDPHISTERPALGTLRMIEPMDGGKMLLGDTDQICIVTLNAAK